VSELRGILSDASHTDGTNVSDFDKISPYVTCHAWVDRKVVEMGTYIDGEDTGGSLTARSRNLTLGPRAPININTAPRPVLVAALYGVGFDGPYTGGLPPAGKFLDISDAQVLADRIIEYREAAAGIGSTSISFDPNRFGFQNWAEYYNFLKGLDSQGNALPAQFSVVTDPLLQDALLANANPNTDLNKWVPDVSIYRRKDKIDLSSATTEFCFQPGGIFTVESLGTVLGPDGQVVAQDKVRSIVRIFERYHETSQDDFETDRIKDDMATSGTSPPGISVPFLRDMTTLPEFRNVGSEDEELACLKANYDGQVIFNVITIEDVSHEGVFYSNIGPNKDLQGYTSQVLGNQTVGSRTRPSGPTPRPTSSSAATCTPRASRWVSTCGAWPSSPRRSLGPRSTTFPRWTSSTSVTAARSSSSRSRVTTTSRSTPTASSSGSSRTTPTRAAR